MPGGGFEEMRADHQGAGIAIFIHEAHPAGATAILVHVESRIALRHGALHRVVHQIAGDDRALAAAVDPHVDMADCGARAARVVHDLLHGTKVATCLEQVDFLSLYRSELARRAEKAPAQA